MSDFEIYCKSLAEENGLDIVSISSYLNSVVEYEGTEQERATIFRSIKENSSQLSSYKLSNIKIDVEFALKTLFRTTSFCNAKNRKLIVVLLQLILDIKNESEIIIGKDESWVVYALYMKGGNGKGLELDILMEYMNKNKPEDIEKDITKDQLEKALDNLEKMKSIELKDGKCFLIETLIL